MIKTDTALKNLEAAQDAFGPIATEANHARAALKRSKSKKNIIRFTDASEAFEIALAHIETLHDAVEAAEAEDAAAELEAAELARREEEPAFL